MRVAPGRYRTSRLVGVTDSPARPWSVLGGRAGSRLGAHGTATREHRAQTNAVRRQQLLLLQRQPAQPRGTNRGGDRRARPCRVPVQVGDDRRSEAVASRSRQPARTEPARHRQAVRSCDSAGRKRRGIDRGGPPGFPCRSSRACRQDPRRGCRGRPLHDTRLRRAACSLRSRYVRQDPPDLHTHGQRATCPGHTRRPRIRARLRRASGSGAAQDLRRHPPQHAWYLPGGVCGVPEHLRRVRHRHRLRLLRRGGQGIGRIPAADRRRDGRRVLCTSRPRSAPGDPARAATPVDASSERDTAPVRATPTWPRG